MFQIRRAEERGVANLEWLDSKHTFSFGHYYDANFMGFGPLRVINEDRIQPGRGFDTHGHQDMEIVSYVLEGALTHKDSLGTGSVIQPGDVQRMTAGTGVRHSEFNHSQSELVHLLQIWILPEKNGLQPSYEQKTFTDEAKRGKLCLIGSRDGRDGSVTIHQDVDLYAVLLDDGEEIEQRLGNGRKGWVQIARGSVRVNDTLLHGGDGVAIAEQTVITLRGSENAEVLLFDMG